MTQIILFLHDLYRLIYKIDIYKKKTFQKTLRLKLGGLISQKEKKKYFAYKLPNRANFK